MGDILYEKLSSLSEISKAQLAKILKTVPTSKNLVLENHVIKPLERICTVSWLKNHGVEKIFKLENVTPQTIPQFYLIYTNVKTFNKVIQQIQSLLDVNNMEKDKFHIICVPKSLYVFEDIVEQAGLWNVIKLYSFQWMPMHLDKSILSLEMPLMFKDIYVKEDFTLLPTYAKSLWHLYLTFGKPKFSLALGQNSNTIMKQLDLYECPASSDYEFENLIIMDRNMDYASTLLTPGTYTALLADIYGIHCGICKHEQQTTDEKLLDKQYNKIAHKKSINLVLDSNKDTVYRAVKDKYFTQVTEILRDIIKDLKVQGETSDMALDEMKRYVQTKLQFVTLKKKLVSYHLNAAETIINCLHGKFEHLMEIEANILQNRSKSKNIQALEEYLQSENDMSSSFALFLLLTQTQKLTDGEIKSFLLKFYAEFGYSYGFIYRNLVQSSIIDSISSSILKLPLLSKSNFFINANKLKQITSEPEKINLKSPNCCSYVFRGQYIPLVAQIASLLLSGTLLDDIKSKLSGIGELEIHGQYQGIKKNLLICIVGGISYSEIAALNLLENLMGVKIIKMSDKLISKHDITNAFISI